MSVRTPYVAVRVALFGTLLCIPTACNQTSSPQTPGSQPSAGRGLSPGDREAVDPDGVVRRGRALSDGETLSVDDVFQRADQLARRHIKVSGAVDSVCTAEGCWFSLQAEDGRFIRVLSKDHGFFVPSKVRGMLATVEGELEVKTPSKKETKGRQDGRELTISAVGLEMTPPPGG